MSLSLKTEALILKKYSLPGSDRIVTLFTKELGRVRAVAKGIKKITSRRLPHIETANLVSVTLSRSKETYYYRDSLLVSGFSNIKSNRENISYVYYLFFILEKILPEEQPEPLVYRTTINFLVDLSKRNTNEAFPLATYINAVLKNLGYTKEELTLASMERLLEDMINEKLPSLSI